MFAPMVEATSIHIVFFKYYLQIVFFLNTFYRARDSAAVSVFFSPSGKVALKGSKHNIYSYIEKIKIREKPLTN